MRTAIVILLLLAGVLFTCLSHAATNAATNLTLNAAITAHDACSNGDTLILPAGDETWTNQWALTKALTILGAGTNATIIRDGMSGTDALIAWTGVSGYAHRMSGIQFQDGGRDVQVNNGIIGITGPATISADTTFRFDHCLISNLFGVAVTFQNAIGVADHNVWVGIPTRRFANTYHLNWNGGSYGDQSWTNANNFGTEFFMFFEDNLLVYLDVNYAVLDSWGGSRFVYRHNTLSNAWFETHGTDSGNRLRGTRCGEIYQNTLWANWTTAYPMNVRGGVILAWSNTVVGFISDPRIELASYRVDVGTWAPWGRADGANQWDTNYLGSISEVLDQPGRSRGGLITGDTPVLPWLEGQNNQVDDPCYEWGNTCNGTNLTFTIGHPNIRTNEHFYSELALPGYAQFTHPHPLAVDASPPSKLWTIGSLRAMNVSN